MPSLLLVVVVASLACALGQVTSFDFPYFNATNKDNFVFNLAAANLNNPAPPGFLYLTSSAGNQAGSVFLKNSVSLLGDNGFKASFSSAFHFLIDNPGGFGDEDGIGADGLVFIVNSVSNNVGVAGGGLGYDGVQKSVGIEFDTYNNGYPQDINGNHVGIDVRGSTISIASKAVPTRLNGPYSYYAWVDFNGETKVLEVRLVTAAVNSQVAPARPTDAFISSVVDLVSILETPNVYIGFSASCGGAYESHKILAFQFINRYAPDSVCGNGVTEIGENCDGGDCCASDCKFKTTVCRASTGPCDAAETCSGSSATCPADTVSSSSTVCRASTGDCDVAETCDGVTGTCPADSFSASSTVCRASTGVCDVAETCSGSSGSCPADSFASSTTVCRASAGVCDAAETCSGTNASCPSDAFSPSTKVCRAAVNRCDIAEKCTGSSMTCPADVLSQSPSCFCDRQAKDPKDFPDYFCVNSTSFYQCVYGPFVSQSAIFVCPSGTGCGCPVGSGECGCSGRRSPCVDVGNVLSAC